MITTLLEYGADPNVQENENVGKNTAMHKATELNMLETIDIFFQHGADGTIQNKNGFTSLHIAAREGLLDMCKLLIAKGKLTLIYIYKFEVQVSTKTFVINMDFLPPTGPSKMDTKMLWTYCQTHSEEQKKSTWIS